MNKEMDRDILISVARTALRTKLAQSVADHLAEVRHDSSHYQLPQVHVQVEDL